MKVVDTGSAIRLLRLPHHLTIVVVGVFVLARESTIDSRHSRSWSINSVRLGGYCRRVVLIGTINNIVSSLMTMEASLVVSDLTSVVVLSFAISLILIICLQLI
jgi:hypothetical protein